jgi:Ca-activated chloride channel homolog
VLRLMYPWFLLALPLPYVLFRYKTLLPSAQFKLKASFFPLLNAQARQNEPKGQGPSKTWCLAFLAWTFLLLASANPVWLSHPEPLWQEGRDLLLAIDISGSMKTKDTTLNGHTVTRLDLIKAVAKQFIHSRVGDRVGLVLFGSRAYLQTPLTFDHSSLISMLEDATVGLAGDQTAIGDALGLSIKHLQALEHTKERKVIVLLTDGVNNAGVIKPLEAARVAHQAHMRIYTIGLAPNKATHWPQGMESVDPKMLQAIAKTTGGAFFQATKHEDLVKIYQTLNKLEPRNQKSLKYRQEQSLYVWPLLLAWLVSMVVALGVIKQKKYSITL